jgi:hypothetical protein
MWGLAKKDKRSGKTWRSWLRTARKVSFVTVVGGRTGRSARASTIDSHIGFSHRAGKINQEWGHGGCG